MNTAPIPTEWTTLQQVGRIHVEREGFIIEGQLDGERVYLLTTVFHGGDYLPGSIRQLLDGHPLGAKGPHLDVTLNLDEDNFRVLLLAEADAVVPQAFTALLGDFVRLAHEWHHELDGHGKDDLIYVHDR